MIKILLYHLDNLTIYNINKSYNQIIKNMDKNLMKYLSTIPVVGAIWITFTAGLIIEINRFFPDILFFYF